MKWKRVAAEFLPEKTFLIIRDDLESVEAVKENSLRRLKAKSALDTGTWPPKIKNHHANHHRNHNRNNRSYITEERPKTANLEKPSVLDPRLLNKLDMSLVSKELLCDSMTRIQLNVKSRAGGGTTMSRNTSSGGSRRRQSVPVGEKSCAYVAAVTRKQTAIACSEDEESSAISLPVGGKKRFTFEQLSANDCSLVLGQQTEMSMENSGMKKPASNRQQKIRILASPDNLPRKKVSDVGKRLDDNNNKNNLSSGANNTNNNTATKIPPPPLSTVKKNKSPKIAVSTEIEVFTGLTKAKIVPEPCKTCGRPDQPERFHSHPRGSILPVKKDSPKETGKSKTPPKTIQKPVALNFRSEKSKSNRTGEEKSPKEEGKSKNNSPREAEKTRKNPSSAARKGPRTVTCYICSREFGTASFPIHEPKCMQKWERENNALPVSQKRPVPQRPIIPLDHADWNTSAWEQSQAQLIPCWKCGRTFLPDRLEIHQRSCKSPRKIRSSRGSPSGETFEKSEQNPNFRTTAAAPSTTTLCQFCGRNFGSRSIKIHEPQCMKKWQTENEKLPLSQRKKIPNRSGDVSPQDSAATTSPTRNSLQKPTTTCYICGRDFGTASIDIHEPQCLIKWRTENLKLPPHQRRKEPQRPVTIYTRAETASGIPVVDWNATSDARWKSHLGQLVPCKHCKRTFNPDRVSIHENSCKGTR